MNDSLVVYRYPDDGNIICFEGVLRQGIEKGFVISPFISKKENFYTVSSEKELCFDDCDIDDIVYWLLKSEKYNINNCTVPEVSTSEADYFYEVGSIIKELKGDILKKTIACRQIVLQGCLNIKATFLALCHNYPKAFIFLFVSPISGAWIGASPELLLKSEDSVISTYALAGTRPWGNSEEWDRKNILEHKIVVDYISEKFKSIGIIPDFTPLMSRRAGNVEHLFKEISGNLKNCGNRFSVSDFLDKFSPTPALCGMPKDESIDRIKRLEKFDRRFYGGFCGIFNDNNYFNFYVNLRSLCFNEYRCCLFAGGGITSYSNPEMEWNETSAKASGIQTCLKFK